MLAPVFEQASDIVKEEYPVLLWWMPLNTKFPLYSTCYCLKCVYCYYHQLCSRHFVSYASCIQKRTNNICVILIMITMVILVIIVIINIHGWPYKVHSPWYVLYVHTHWWLKKLCAVRMCYSIQWNHCLVILFYETTCFV